MTGPASRRPRTRLFAPSRLNLKTVLTACAGVLLIGAILYVLWHTKFAMLITVLGLLIAVPLDHGVRWFERHRVPRPVAIGMLLLALVATIVGIVWLFVPPTVAQIRDLARHGPQLVDELTASPWYRRIDQVADLDAALGSVVTRLREDPAAIATSALSAATAVLSGVAGLVLVLFIAAFLLIYGSGAVQWILDNAFTTGQRRLRGGVERAYRAVGGYVAGVGLLVVINAVVTSIFLAILGLPYFLLLGILSGLSSLVPVIGVILVGAIVALIAGVSLGAWFSVGVAIYMVVYQQVENHLLAPLVYRHTVSLNPLPSVLTALFLGELAGVAGAVLAIPGLAVLKIIVTELLAIRNAEATAPTERGRESPGDPADRRCEPGPPP